MLRKPKHTANRSGDTEERLGGETVEERAATDDSCGSLNTEVDAARSETERLDVDQRRGGDMSSGNERVLAPRRKKSKRRTSDDRFETESDDAGRRTKQRSEMISETDGIPAPSRDEGHHETEGRIVPHPTAIDDGCNETENGIVDPADSSELRHDPDKRIAEICQTLVQLQRQRRSAMKFRQKLDSGTTAWVAAMTGYSNMDDEKERKKAFDKARALVKSLDRGEPENDNEKDVAPIVAITFLSRKAFEDYEDRLTKEMTRLAKKLPVAPWFSEPDRRGISLVILATIVGEAGDLSNYSTVSKLWRRLFGAPHTKDGKTRMPSTWRQKGGLTSEDWRDKVQNSPRRTSSTYSLRENIVRQNFTAVQEPNPDKPGKTRNKRDDDGNIDYIHCCPYRARYDEAKVLSKANPDHQDEEEWPDARHANHAKLLAAKRFALDLWVEWRRRGQ